MGGFSYAPRKPGWLCHLPSSTSCLGGRYGPCSPPWALAARKCFAAVPLTLPSRCSLRGFLSALLFQGLGGFLLVFLLSLETFAHGTTPHADRLMGARIPRGLILPALLLEDWVAAPPRRLRQL